MAGIVIADTGPLIAFAKLDADASEFSADRA